VEGKKKRRQEMRKEKMLNNKGFKVVAFLLVLGLTGFSSGNLLRAGIEVSFRLSGSPLGYLLDGAGDIDLARKGVESNLVDLAQNPDYSTSFNWGKPSRINDFRAEILFKISRNFGISLGSGYIFAKNQGAYTVDYSYEDYYGWSGYYSWENVSYENCDYTRKYTVSAVPITLDAFVFLPIGKKRIFNIYAHAGVGYYFGKMKHILGLDDVYSYVSSHNGGVTYHGEGVINLTFTEKTSSRSWGYHGGLGLDIKMARFFSFGAEVYGRRVEFSDWEGSQVITGTQKGSSWNKWGGGKTIDSSETESAFGNLWTYVSKCSDEGKGYTLMWVWDEEPESSCFVDVRKAYINLNAYGISFSFKLSFNLF
jgi:hypothetical protein